MANRPYLDRPPVDPGIRALLDASAEAGQPPLVVLSPAQARARVSAGDVLCSGGPRIAEVSDIEIAEGPGVAVAGRLYRQGGAGAGVVVYMHGGGWVTGDLEYADQNCRHLADVLGMSVLSVRYRLAPEHRFPAAVDDAYAALLWADRFLRGSGPLVVAGDSAGGNLAAACALRARDEGTVDVCAQFLLYPVTDHDLGRASYTFNAGNVLGAAEMEWFWNHYVPEPAERAHPWASPVRAPSLAGMPPAVLLLAGHDPLLDEGWAYARGLGEAGVLVVVHQEPAMAHGFLRFSAKVPTAVPALRSAADRLRLLLPLTNDGHG